MAITIEDVRNFYGPPPETETTSATEVPEERGEPQLTQAPIVPAAPARVGGGPQPTPAPVVPAAPAMVSSGPQSQESLLAEGEARLGSQTSREQQWNKEMGLPPLGGPMPTRGVTSTTPAVTPQTLQAPDQVSALRPSRPAGQENWLKPTGNVALDLGKGMIGGIGGAVAAEVDTIDWLANKVADVIPGLGRQEVIGKIRDALKPGDLEKDEETLAYTIGNALGYGATQFGLLYAMIFKPLQGAKLLSLARLKDAPKLLTAGGRAAIRAGGAVQTGKAGLEATLKAAPLAAQATELWGAKAAAEVAKKTGIVARGLDKLGNVHLAGPVGLGAHGAITGAKEGERGSIALAGEAGRDATVGERLQGAMEGFAAGGTQGFMMGTALGLLNNFSQIKRSGAMGAVFGGMSLYESGDVKRGFADFLTGALMGWMPAKPGEKWLRGLWPEKKLPSSSPSAPGVDPKTIEDLVDISQAANVNIKTSKEWARSMGYSEPEAALRIAEAEKWYGVEGEKTVRPFIHPDLGLVLKRGSTKGDAVVDKVWAAIQKTHNNRLEAALEMGKWAQSYKRKIGIDDNPILGGLMDNVIHTLTRDHKGYSPVGSAYHVPASAFSGTHSAGWAGNIYREIAKAQRLNDNAKWSALTVDGVTVPLAESTGSRLGFDSNPKTGLPDHSKPVMFANDGTPIPVSQIRAIINDKTGSPLIEQPQKTVLDIQAERRVADKAAAKLAIVAAAAKKVEVREAKKVAKAAAKADEAKTAVTKPYAPFQLGPDRANAERMIKDMEARAKKGEDVSTELESAKGDLADSVAVEGALANLQAERDALKNSIEKVLSPEQRRQAGERLGVFEEELLTYWRSSTEKKVPKERIVSKGAPERPTEQAVKAGEKLPLDKAKELISEYDENILKIKSKDTPKEDKGKAAMRNNEINETLNSRQGYKGDTSISMVALKNQISRETSKLDFKPYGPTEPSGFTNRDLEGISNAFGVPVHQIEQILSPLGAPKSGSPELVPFVLEKQFGFTKQQAKLIAGNDSIAELIFDGAKGDGSVPFTAKDFFIGELGEIKPLSPEANKWMKNHVKELRKLIPELQWKDIRYLEKVEGKSEGPIRELVEYWTLNDMVHSLDMKGRETFKDTYQRDLKDAPGISNLPKEERYVVKVAELINNHKFSNEIFGTRKYVKEQIQAIAKSTGREPLSDKQLELAATWVTMQNEARGIDTTTGRTMEEAEARKIFSNKWKKGERGEAPARSVTIEDVRRYNKESNAPEWGEVADMAQELAKATAIPIAQRDRVELLKGRIKELEVEAKAFGFKFDNIGERVRAANKIRELSDRIDTIKNSKIRPENQKTQISELEDRISLIKKGLPELRKGMTKQAALKEEFAYGPGKMKDVGDIEAFRTLSRVNISNLADAYATLGRIKYQENPLNWLPGERRLLRTPDGEPLNLVVGSGKMPAIGPLQAASMEASLRRAAKKYYVDEINGFTSGVSTTIGYMAEIAPGLKVPMTGSMTGEFTLERASGISPETRQIRREALEEALGESKLTPVEKDRAREVFWQREVDKMKGENLAQAHEREMTAEMDKELEKLYASDLTPYGPELEYLNAGEAAAMEATSPGSMGLEAGGPGLLGVTPVGTTRQKLFEPRQTPEQYALQKQATGILKGASVRKEGVTESTGAVEAEEMPTVLKKLPSGKMEHPKVAGAKEETLTKSQIALEPVTRDTPKGPQAVPGEFRVVIFQEALTQKELNVKKEGVKQAELELKTADRKPQFFPEQEAKLRFPWIERGEKETQRLEKQQRGKPGKIVTEKQTDSWLEREALQKGAPKLVWKRVTTGAGPEGQKLLFKDRIELVEGKRETDKVTKQVKTTTTGKADILYQEPKFPTREFEPGYMVSDRDVLKHDIRRLKAEIVGTTVIQPKGKLPVIMDGKLTFDEVSGAKGEPTKLVWKFTWNGADPERIPPGDARQVQLARNAERMIQDYLKVRTPLPFEGEYKVARRATEYEFIQSDKPTILEKRTGKLSEYKQAYKDKYGVEYTGEPLTSKVFRAPVTGAKGKVTGRWTETDIPMSKAEIKAERKQAAIIDEWQRREDVMKMTYAASEIENRVYQATGQRYESLEKQAGPWVTGNEARTGKTPAELKFKRPGSQLGFRNKSERDVSKQLAVGATVESIPDQTSKRLKGVVKEVEARTVETPEQRDTTYRQEFVEDLSKVPIEVRGSLLKYRRDIGRQDVMEFVTIPQAVYGLKGYGEKAPAKRSEARNLMQRQLNTRLEGVRNVEQLSNHLNSLVLDYEKASYQFDSQVGVDRDFAAGRMTEGLKSVTKMMELLLGRRYSPQEYGVQGPILKQAKNWLQSFDEASTNFKVKLGEERFGVSKRGDIVDLEKPGAKDLMDYGRGFSMEKALAENEARLAERDRVQEKFLEGREPSEIIKGKGKEVKLDELFTEGNPETSGLKGGPGEQRYYKKPVKEEVKPGIITVGGKEVVLPNASSKEVEKALKKGIKFSQEANQDPGIRNKIKEMEMKIALEEAVTLPPVQTSQMDKDRVAKKVITQPMTTEEILWSIKNREDLKRSSTFMTEVDRVKMYNMDPMEASKLYGPLWEIGGQFSQSIVPEKKLLGDGAANERMHKNYFLRTLMYDEASPMKRIRNLATKVRGVKDGQEGLEKIAEAAMYFDRKPNYGSEPTDPAIKEVFRIVREELAPGFAKSWDMKGLGVYANDFLFPLVTDMNRTFTKVKERYNISYKELDKIKGGDTLQALVKESEWGEIQDIFKRRTFWNQSKVTPHDMSSILNPHEKDLLSRTVFQWSGALDNFRNMPGQKKAALRLKDSFNKHLQERSEGVDFLSYKHNFADVWESYIYDMAQIQYVNNIKKLATPLLNAYPKRDVRGTIGWEMETYMKGLFGTYSPVDKYLATKTEILNEKMGREIINPNFVAKGLATKVTGMVVKGAVGFWDSSVRQLSDQLKILVDDPTWGKLYFKSFFSYFNNLMTKPGTKGLGDYYKWWDAFGVGRESYEGAPTGKKGLGERLGQTESIPRKMWTLYDWIGEKGLSLFGMMEHFNKGVSFIFNANKMKYEGADWDTACQIGIKSASTLVPNQKVPWAMRQVLDRTLEQQIGYTKEHRNIYMGANSLTRLSSTFMSYPGDMLRKVWGGAREGWQNREADNYNQFLRYVTYLGFQLSIASAVGYLGYDVASTFGVGILPVKAMSLPWEILYNSYVGIDPLKFVGKPQYQEEERQKALYGLRKALGILFIPQYRWGKGVIDNLTSLEKGFKQNINGRDIMEWSVPKAVMTFMGAPPIENRETYNLQKELDTLTKQESAKKQTLVKEGIEALKNRDSGALAKVREKAKARGIPLSYADIRHAYKELQEVTVLEKEYKKIPKHLRPQYKARIEELKGRAFPGGEYQRKFARNRNMWSNVEQQDNYSAEEEE